MYQKKVTTKPEVPLHTFEEKKLVIGDIFIKNPVELHWDRKYTKLHLNPICVRGRTLSMKSSIVLSSSL